MKTKRMIVNFLSDTIPLMIVAILGIFKLKLFLQVLGDETLGLYQLCQQIMVYVAIVDGGVAVSVTVTEDPVQTKTTVSEICLPSFERMDETYTIKAYAVSY